MVLFNDRDMFNLVLFLFYLTVLLILLIAFQNDRCRSKQQLTQNTVLYSLSLSG